MIKQLMKQLLAIVPFKDHILSNPLDVGIRSSSSPNDSRNHQNGLSWDYARNTVKFFLAKTGLLSVACTGLKRVDASTKVTLCQIYQLVNHVL